MHIRPHRGLRASRPSPEPQSRDLKPRPQLASTSESSSPGPVLYFHCSISASLAGSSTTYEHDLRHPPCAARRHRGRARQDGARVRLGVAVGTGAGAGRLPRSRCAVLQGRATHASGGGGGASRGRPGRRCRGEPCRCGVWAARGIRPQAVLLLGRSCERGE